VIALTGLLCLVAAVLLLPTFADCWAALRAVRRRHPSNAPRIEQRTPRLLFLVPAHNEEMLVGDCVRALQGQDYDRQRFDVSVVADNCTDETAARARATGARCLERTAPGAPGKPWAIAWALDRLSLASYDAVAIIDADTVVDPAFARSLSAVGPLSDKVVQPFNDVLNRGDSAVTRMAAVFAACRFLGSFQLKQRAGFNIPLSDGLCIGTKVLREHGWHVTSICEDWELYASLTARGVRIELAADAHLYAQEARTLRQGASQRHRWTAGKVSVLARYGRAVLGSGRIGLGQKLDALAELLLPGPALHAGLVTALVVTTLALRPPGAAALAFLFGGSMVRTAAYTAVGLVRDPTPMRSALAFAFLPVYVVWRLVTGLNTFASLRRQAWTRTARVPHSGGEA
jgi:1,2-diacylglycerol 3-beta-glucosyltransferase